jgi:hypothetical protein
MKRILVAVYFVSLSYMAAMAMQQNKGHIEGRVIDEAKRPIADAVIGIAETTAKGDINEMAPMTDAQGVFDWADLPAGRYVFLVNAPGFKTLKQAVEIRAGATAKAEFVLMK